MINKVLKEFFAGSYVWAIAFLLVVISLILAPLISNPRWLAFYHFGLLIYVIALIRDIHRKSVLDHEALQKKAISDHASRLSAIGVLAGGVAHEINNPLSIILGNVKILTELSRQVTGETQNDYSEKLEKIQKATQRISHIILSLKLFSKQSSSEPMSKVPLADTLKMALNFCQERFHNNKVELEIGAIPDVIIDCYAAQISQVFLSLLNNAFEAVKSRPGASVQVSFKVDRKVVIATVTDNGPGIPEKNSDHIFTPFFSTKETGDGAGMGLSIARGIAKHHDGDIRLLSKANPTTFVFTMPIAS